MPNSKEADTAVHKHFVVLLQFRYERLHFILLVVYTGYERNSRVLDKIDLDLQTMKYTIEQAKVFLGDEGEILSRDLQEDLIFLEHYERGVKIYC